MYDAWLRELDTAIEAFVIPLRMGDGFNEPAFSALREALRRTAEAVKNSPVIPKRCAALLVELDPALKSGLSWYHGEELIRITHAIDEIYRLTLDCVVEP